MASKMNYEMKAKHSFESPSSEIVYDINEATVDKNTLRTFRAWLKKLSVETGGIQRITDEERQQNSSKVWNACTFW